MGTAAGIGVGALVSFGRADAATGVAAGRYGTAAVDVGGTTGGFIESTAVAVDAAREAAYAAVTGTLLKALRKASAVWKRCDGSLAIAIRIISFSSAGRPGCNSAGGLGVSLTWAAM